MAITATTRMQWFAIVDGLLRGRTPSPREPHGDSKPNLLCLVMILIVFGLMYGAAMGSIGDTTGPDKAYRGTRALQMLYSAMKVPLLLLCTFVLSIPSFFVVNTLFGLRDDFTTAIRGLLATQAALTVILASFAPFTLLAYASTTNYDFAVLFNGLMFGAASIAAQIVLKRAYRPLIEKNARHRTLLRAWMGIYAFVGIQMSWVLRPFIGKGDLETRFFRDDIWGNAYVEVFRKIVELLG